MNSESSSLTWWDLHLRKVRGDSLSEAEQQRYDAELARHDREEAPLGRVEAMRQLRDAATALTRDNAQLRERLAQLEAEIRTVEQALSRQSRELLGVSE